MDFFTLYYKDYTFQKQFKDILNDEILKILKSNTKICGQKRTRNRGICMRQCSGIACKYHLKNILPDDVKHMKKCKKYPTYLETVSEYYYEHKNDVFDFFDLKKINNSNNIINRETLNKTIIKDKFFSNLTKQNTPKLICYHNENNIYSSFISTLTINKKNKKKKKRKKRKKKHNIMIRKNKLEEKYNELLSLNKKIKIYINNNHNLNDLDKRLLQEFIDRLTNNFEINENTEICDLKNLSENIHIKLIKYLNIQIKNNNKNNLSYIIGVFNLYMYIFDEKYKEDYDSDPIHYII